MSKPVKNLIIETYKQRFDGLDGAVLIDIRGIKSNDNNRLRHGLAQKRVKVSVVKNSLAQRAFADTDLAKLNELLEGPTALVYPLDESVSVVGVARELINWAKQLERLEFKGALMEGILFGPDQIEALSKYPTREEAQSQVVQILLTPAQKLVGSILSPGRKVASLIEAIREKLEQGQTITKKAG